MYSSRLFQMQISNSIGLLEKAHLMAETSCSLANEVILKEFYLDPLFFWITSVMKIKFNNKLK